MVWTVDYTATAKAQLGKLDRQTAKRILDFMDQRVVAAPDPRRIGKVLTGPLGGLWRYRVGDCRVICDLQDGNLRVLVLQIGNRNQIYR